MLDKVAPVMPDALSILRDLIRCPSVTPHEGGALDLIETLLKKAGFRTQRLVFSAPGTPDVDNLYARLGTQAPHLLFAGHTDVVPPGDEAAWKHPPFGAEIANGAVYGRGAVDMKGGLACALAAVLAFLEDQGPPKGSIGFLITGDEEGPAINGTLKVLGWMKERGEHFDHCILGEPTNPSSLSDMIKIGRRGSLTGHLTVQGKQGHVAYPALAINPIRGLTRLINALQETPLDAGNAHFDPSNLEFTSVDVGNRASNVIPNTARATFNIRFNDAWTHATLEAELRRRCAACGDVEFRLEIEPSNASAFVTEPGPFVEVVAEAVAAQTGKRPALSTTGGTSDARFIKAHGPVLEYGLVGQSMHQIDEHARLADIEGLTRIYGRVLERYFS
jgi:succinyl-diaminopimelate desuccinylase